MSRRFPALSLLAAGVIAACGNGSGGGTPAPVDGAPPTVSDGGAPDAAVSDGPEGLSRSTLLGAFARCVKASAGDFLTRASELKRATAALAATPDPARTEEARTAFRAAMDAWQIAEMFQVGPAAASAMPGGQDLREHIYSWPLVNPCVVEAELVSRGYESAAFPMSLVNRRGLAVLEYLLFHDGATSACPAGAPPGWAMLAPEDRGARTRAYAAAAAADLERRAQSLVDAWETGKGGFADTLAGAGPGNKTFATAQLGLNAVSGALFYLDEVKDMKIARMVNPGECVAPACPESPFARRTKANVQANLIAFRRIAEGCEGPSFQGLGFDDLLEALGAAPVAMTVRQRGAAAQAALDAIEEPDLPAAAAADVASVRALHAGVKGLTDLLKMEFRTLLDLEIPAGHATDND